MEILIRQITEDDVSSVTSLCEQLGYMQTTMQTLKNIKEVLASENHKAFIAEYNGHVIGWIGLSKILQIESGSCCEIRGLVVDEKSRNKGIGKMLIEKAKQWAREKGNNSLRLRCNLKRREAHLFYQHIGFKEIKEQKVFEIEV
jgi:N-acetylglutamate synthase-like GNAT family acetyltransferase